MTVTKVIITHFVIVVCLLGVMSKDAQNTTIPLNVTLTKNVIEGGPINVKAPLVETTHLGREHMLQVPLMKNKTEDAEPPPFEVPEKNDDKNSVPRKGVDFPNVGNISSTSSTTSTTTTTTTTSTTTTTKKTTTTTTTITFKPKKKKPLFTEASDDAPLPSNFDTQVKKNQTKIHHISMMDDVPEKKKTDYIVPIVVVIMSVPLVAILISVLYKRGSEWWQHRHYRRMDFLIEGMYNN